MHGGREKRKVLKRDVDVHVFHVVNSKNQEVKGYTLSIRDRWSEWGFGVYLHSISKVELV